MPLCGAPVTLTDYVGAVRYRPVTLALAWERNGVAPRNRTRQSKARSTSRRPRTGRLSPKPRPDVHRSTHMGKAAEIDSHYLPTVVVLCRTARYLLSIGMPVRENLPVCYIVSAAERRPMARLSAERELTCWPFLN